MEEWRLRLNEFEGYYDILIEMFEDDLFKWVCVVHHTGKKKENPHFHAVFKTEGYDMKQLREMISKRFTKAKGNKNYSLLPSDGRIEAKSYLFHEDTPVEYSKNLTDDELKEYKLKNYEIVKELKENTPVKIIDRVYHILKTSGKYDHFPPPPENVFHYLMLDLMSRSEFIPNKFQMERWINRVRSQFAVDNNTKHMFIRDLYTEMFSQATPQWKDIPRYDT